jgi:hypothetical protein
VLWLITEEGQACLRLAWDGKDRFTTASTEPGLVFARAPVETETHADRR